MTRDGREVGVARMRELVGQERRYCTTCAVDRDFRVFDSWTPATHLLLFRTRRDSRRKLECPQCGFQLIDLTGA